MGLKGARPQAHVDLPTRLAFALQGGGEEDALPTARTTALAITYDALGDQFQKGFQSMLPTPLGNLKRKPLLLTLDSMLSSKSSLVSPLILIVSRPRA